MKCVVIDKANFEYDGEIPDRYFRHGYDNVFRYDDGFAAAVLAAGVGHVAHVEYDSRTDSHGTGYCCPMIVRD